MVTTPHIDKHRNLRRRLLSPLSEDPPFHTVRAAYVAARAPLGAFGYYIDVNFASEEASVVAVSATYHDTKHYAFF